LAFGDSTVVVGVFIYDGTGVTEDSIYMPSGFSAGKDSVINSIHWYSVPAAIGDTASFCILAWDSAGNTGRSPENGWHQVVNTGIGGNPAQGLPTCFGLSKAFPNPSRHGCLIKYQLPKDSPITLAVYNLTGQRVKLLEEGRKPAGYHQVRWDGRDDGNRKTAAGIYFYRLTAEGYQKTERLVIVR